MKKICNIMIDLETLSTESNAVIISIGAVKAIDGHETQTFLQNVTGKSGEELGLHISKETLNFWCRQDIELCKSLRQNAIELSKALKKLSEFIKKDTDNCEVLIWGNGADFDNVILKSSYNATGMSLPWDYRNVRCYRTLANLFPTIKKHEFNSFIKHNPLHDALVQSDHLSLLLKAVVSLNTEK